MNDVRREGSLDAPIRLPIDWKSGEFYDEISLFDELNRVYDICHSCRRCVSLCNAFPTLFDLIDESESDLSPRIILETRSKTNSYKDYVTKR